MWQRWNQTTHIFEKSDNDGASWVPLPLSGSIITEGTVADARLSSNVPLKNAANIFSASQRTSGDWENSATSTGLVNTTNGNKFISSGSFWDLLSGNNTDVYIRFRTLNGTVRGYLYWDSTANKFGLLDSSGNWQFAVDTSGIYELGRTLGLGKWTSFTPTLTADAGTWTFGTNESQYCLIGDVCFVHLRLENTSLSSTPAILTVGSFPKTIAGGTINKRWDVFHGGGWEANNFVQLAGGGTGATIQRNAGGFYTTGAGLYIRENFFYKF